MDRRAEPSGSALRIFSLRVRSLLVGLSFVACIAGAFGAAVAAPFAFDDVPAIEQNASIRGWSPPSRPFDPPGLGTPVSGRPIANASLAVDYTVNQVLGVSQVPVSEGERQTIAYHVTSLLIHIGVALLLFGLARRIIA